MRIRDGKNSDSGSGMEKSRIGDLTSRIRNTDCYQRLSTGHLLLSFSMPEPVPGLGHLAAQLTDEGGQVARQVLRLYMPEYVRLHLKGRDGREQKRITQPL